MSHPTELTFKTLQFYSTASYPCSYIEGREARSQVAAPTHLIDAATYSRLVEKGFRRSGLFTYRPHCDACRACLPIRVDVERFQPSRTQKKIWRRHQHLRAGNAPLEFELEHFELYRRYVSTRHAGAGMDDDDQSQYTQFLLTSRVDTTLIEFRDESGVLQMVSIIDILDTGLSAVYTFFDPQAPGSLGTYGVLWQIDRCRAMGLPWLYLGYWIGESRKMAYKTQYRPCEILRGNHWSPL
ncbi:MULTISPECIES: arginyltransferase [Pusillimonas]|uniref:arginyltransferase n=1 Tax=Pusillimonas TaxID=305976 RepID=UPI000E59D333|nr:MULTISPECIES: arginyltransferase [Pusillimonas]MDX3895424.1 arginyltransferase [Pusillimonas sp.]TFL13061.1 arginyltransferase [Pusillimonas caeni]